MRREEDRSPLSGGLTQQTVEGLLDERIEAGDRLIEDQQLGLVHERLDESSFWRLPVESSSIGRPSSVSKRSARASRTCLSTPPRRVCQVVEHRLAGQRRIESELSGQEADAAS